MNRLIQTIAWPLLLLILSAVPATAQFHDADWLEQGLLAEFRGEPENALQIWMEAFEELEEPDARIGFEFIRVATEHELDAYYEVATTFYNWAVSEPFSGVNRAAIRQEIERLRPILGTGIYRQWLGWFEERNPELGSDMRGFWKQLDPTPGSTTNERLLEHWIRIAESRDRFDRNRTTIYGTDDRAYMYVRYGEPDHTRGGTLSIDRQRVGEWLARQFEAADPPRESSQQGDVSFELQSHWGEEDESFEQLQEYIFQFHQQPEYEIWIYRSLGNQAHEEPLIFIFGTDPTTGEYRRIQSIDDLIPPRAYLSDRRSSNYPAEFVRQGLTPALAMQMLYYEQLVDTDTFFDRRLSDIRESFIEQGPMAYSSLDLALRSQNRELLQIRESETPREISSAARLIPPIPVDLYQYRRLDGSGRPVLLTFLESRPYEALQSDHRTLQLARGTEPERTDSEPVDVSPYRLNHHLILFDDSWNDMALLEHNPGLVWPDGNGGETVIQSVFETRHEQSHHQSASAQLIRQDISELHRYTQLFSAGLRGLGGLKNRQPPPLRAEPDRLEMADLILGFRDPDLPEDYPFSFRVANDQMIPSDESLVLHFEVYQLQPAAATGFTRFELTYRIYPVLEDGTVVTDREEFYLTIHFEDDRTTVIEELEIQTSDLSRGLYELQVFIEDLESEQEVSRDIRFEVTDRPVIEIQDDVQGNDAAEEPPQR